MNSISISNLLAYSELLAAGYLLILGLIGLIRWKSNRKELFYHVACIFLSIVLISNQLELTFLSESTTLLLWTFFYLFICDSLPSRDSGLMRYSSFLLPTLWVFISLTFPNQSYVHFQTIYFLHFVLIALSSAHKTHKINSSQVFAEQHLINYLRWLHFGLLILIGIRLTLPLLIVAIDTYIAGFHLLLVLYLVGISAFQRGATKATISLHVEETTNLEDLTKRKLDSLFKKDQAYLIPDLTINELAAKMQMKASDLSTFFNSKLGMNFNDVVNQHRIEEVKRLIVDSSTDPKSTIMELAYKSGFNSKATFNRIFKQLTGDTPKEYRKKYGNQVK